MASPSLFRAKSPIIHDSNPPAEDGATSEPSINNLSVSTSDPSMVADFASSPTPISSCSFPGGIPPDLSRKIIFNEIAWMGSTSSSNEEWMELKNITSDRIDLSG